MFREVEYVTEDYSVRVVDGLLRFSYWLPYFRKKLNEGELFATLAEILFFVTYFGLSLTLQNTVHFTN